MHVKNNKNTRTPGIFLGDVAPLNIHVRRASVRGSCNLCKYCISMEPMNLVYHRSPVPGRTHPRIEDIPNYYTPFHLLFMYHREIYKCKFLARGRTWQTCRKFSASVATVKIISSDFQPSWRYIS